MREVLFNAWKETIQSEMDKLLPMFSRLKKKSPGEWPRMLKYISERPNGALWAISFRPLDEEFDAFVGWSRDGQSPFSQVVMVATDEFVEQFQGNTIMLPTAVIAHRRGETYWSFWNPTSDIVSDPTRFSIEYANYSLKSINEEEALSLVRNPISEAINEILTYCIPYIENATRAN